MSGDSTKFSTVKSKNKGSILFKNISELKVLGIGDIKISEHLKIKNV